MNNMEQFFENLAEVNKNLLINEQSVIAKELAEAERDAAADGDETAKVKVVIEMEIMTGFTCKPKIVTRRTVKRSNEAEVVSGDATPKIL